MDEDDVIAFMGRPPDQIDGPPLLATEWTCDRCGEVYHSAVPTRSPAPCDLCGGIGFICE